MRSGDEEEEKEEKGEKEEEKEEKQATNIKSNNPHLAGGEQRKIGAVAEKSGDS